MPTRRSSGRSKCSSQRTPGSTTRLVRDYFEIADHCSLTSLIEALEVFRSTLAGSDGAEINLVGDDDFGRCLRITYLRELTAEEAALDRRYSVRLAPIPSTSITKREVRYEEHTPLMWGDYLHAPQPS